MASFEQSCGILLRSLTTLWTGHLTFMVAFNRYFFICQVYWVLFDSVVCNDNFLSVLRVLFTFISTRDAWKKTVYTLADSLENPSAANVFFGWNSKGFCILRYFQSLFSCLNTKTWSLYRRVSSKWPDLRFLACRHLTETRLIHVELILSQVRSAKNWITRLSITSEREVCWLTKRGLLIY